MQDLPDRLKSIRGKLSQSVFSARVGIPQRTWSRYESGESAPDFKTAQGICRTLNIEPKWLLFGDGPMHPDEPAYSQGSAPEPAEPDRCPRCANAEKIADDLRSEMSKERDMNRELVAENRQLWKENSELRERLARLEERQNAQPVSGVPSTTGNVA